MYKRVANVKSYSVANRTLGKMEKIKLTVMNGTPYVWCVEDWMRIRNLRILGNFIGNLAVLSKQDQLAGLPLALLKEETTLLLENGHAVIKQISNILVPPNKDIQSKSSQHFEKLFLEQTEFMRAKRKLDIESKIDIILEGKKAKRACPEALSKESVLEEEMKRLQSIKPSSVAIQICTDDPWVEEKDYEDCQWDYPKTDIENLHYSVFKDLWLKGYYITPGRKFGGNYLVYPGDPIKFHAFFIVICVEKKKVLPMNEFIIYGRLGQSVRKTVVLAYLNENNEVCYQSVQWSGF